MSKLEILLREWCSQELHRGSHGPSPRYCNAACCMKACRARRAAAAVCAELQAEGTRSGPVVHAHPAPRASTDEQVARAFLEAKSLAGVFARLGVGARPGLAWRCTHVADALTAAINETLGGN